MNLRREKKSVINICHLNYVELPLLSSEKCINHLIHMELVNHLIHMELSY